ncbi:MAG: hypothetical protein U0935_03315 [Pirellulales bacterium]
MLNGWGWLAVLTTMAATTWAAVSWRRRTARRERPAGTRQAKAAFQQRREWLEARFVTLAAAQGKPRGLAWTDCEFASTVSWARDRESGELRALVAVTIHFAPVPGGGMEHNPNVALPRAATAVFQWHEQEWLTDGRVLFNLTPAQAIEHFQHELETAD